MEGGRNAEKVAAAADSLPDDALVDILSRVPVRSTNRFKCVSKHWRGLIADPLHRKRLPQTLEGFFCSDESGSSAGFDGRFISLPGRSAPPVDPSVSFLTKLPGIENLRLLGSCNGLLLFEHGSEHGSNPDTAPAYAVCNPATEEWVAVPSAGCPYPDPQFGARTYLIFDPAVSPHFHLVHVCQEDYLGEIEVRAYSSETNLWSESDCGGDWKQWRKGDEWGQLVRAGVVPKSKSANSAFVNGMVHFIVSSARRNVDVIVAMDREGKACRIIRLPDGSFCTALFVGQSQGRLHCMRTHFEGEGNSSQVTETGISVWVLEDYDAGQWVLKHIVKFSELGEMHCPSSCHLVTIHPDRDLVFFLQLRDSIWELISYDMDSKEVHACHTFGNAYCSLTPYIPFLSESSVLPNKH
ncbi:unnamed protein product [Urochloa decumbens]|uniref:F-box domain-containing protein n=1 Tax=Urochloa decumbens TaxID=240449 RepID=A0ABC9HAR5_9POAL